MLVIGLTGGIATGKSTVSKLLSHTHHIQVVDADVLARQVVAPGTPALSRIVSTFGPSVLLPDDTLDRKKLGTIVFNDEAKRRQLNAIVHPSVKRAMIKAVLACWFRGEKFCVLDVPLLVESSLWKWVGRVVVVYCSPEIQLQRLMTRDASTLEEASSRLSSQMPIGEKVAYADVVIDNSGSLNDLEVQVDAFVRKLVRHSSSWMGLWWKLCWLIPPVAVLSALWTLSWRSMRRTPKRNS